MAQSFDDAGQRASQIVELLPLRDRRNTGSSSKDREAFSEARVSCMEDNARALGVAIFLAAAKTGVDEGDFDTDKFSD